MVPNCHSFFLKCDNLRSWTVPNSFDCSFDGREKMFDDLKMFISSGHCPSEHCWTYDAKRKKCFLNHIDDCYKVLCEWDEMIVVISSNLYGTKTTFVTDKCAPKWNTEYGFWVMRHTLGECKPKMNLSTKHGNEYINIITDVQRYRVKPTEMAKKPRTRNLTRLMRRDKETEIQDIAFQCRYPTLVRGIGDGHDFEPRDQPRKGTNAFSYGRLDPGFELELFSDNSYHSKLNNWSIGTYIGSKVYGKVTWLLSTLKRTKFFVERCEVDINANKVNIIQENCYLKIFGARPESKSLVRTKSARFSFNSFTIKNTSVTASQKERVQCDIRICIPGKCNLTSKERCSEIQEGDIGYSITGQK